MSVGLPSDEVAEDYKNSLEDLTMNSRYEISNLTVIAKENTEHALAISRVIENHIRYTPPERKLPALYVLDSVVKNVGSPYTLYLGRELYKTFMDAYCLVGLQVRKKLDEMLKTWKEPVPGTLDTKPVFPVETTRPIENALIKARTIAIQQQTQQVKSQQELLGRGRPTATPPVPWRHTPTPPQTQIRYPQAPPRYPSQHLQNGHMQSPYAYPTFSPVQPTPPQFQQPYQQPGAYSPQPQPHSASNLDSLHRDIEALVSTARTAFAGNPYDRGIQERLKALLDLQSILKNQQLPPDQIQQIRDQVAQLSLPAKPVMALPAPQQAPTQRPAPSPMPFVFLPQPLPQPPPPQPTPQQPDLQSLLSSNALADLLASVSKSQQAPPTPSNPRISLREPQIPSSQPSANTMPASNGGESTLIASLRAAGMLPPSMSTPPINSQGSAHPPFQFQRAASTLTTPPTQPANLAHPALNGIRNDVQLTSASLKTPRPHLISTLYEARPNQCSTCGKRFLATEEGRTKKARHLDWHFRTNQRLADAARRGQSRSWYVDELEWIKSRDDNEETFSAAPNGSDASKASAAATAAANDPKNKYIPVPSDPALANAPCPICQEKFDTSWSDEAQDFVWMDAVKLGGRVYHASCHAEVKKEGGNTPLRTGTPDSVLGKRKAGILNGEVDSLRTKVKREIMT